MILLYRARAFGRGFADRAGRRAYEPDPGYEDQYEAGTVLANWLFGLSTEYD